MRDLYPKPPRPDIGAIRPKSAAASRVADAERLLGEVGTGPVAAAPHSAKRLAALIAREAQGLPLWNPEDVLEDKA